MRVMHMHVLHGSQLWCLTFILLETRSFFPVIAAARLMPPSTCKNNHHHHQTYRPHTSNSTSIQQPAAIGPFLYR
uniref:Secreted protein n=1 Tax=Setaria italica TaxID=4555 RepID=K3YXC8_SETIT